MRLPIGIEIPYTDLQDRTSLIALAREAEDLGYDCIWCSEVYTYDAFTTLTQIACETSTISPAPDRSTGCPRCASSC